MFSTTRRIEFGMCDAAGILFFAKIFELSHSAYEEFILKSNLKLNVFDNNEFAVPIICSSSEYHNPIKLHEEIIVELNVTKIGRTSFELTANFFDAESKLKATVKTTHVFVSKSNFEKAEIPKEFLTFLGLNKV